MPTDTQTVLLGLKAFSTNSHSLLLRATRELKKKCSQLEPSAIYKVHADSTAPKRIHDLRSHESYEGLTVVVKAQTAQTAQELIEMIEEIEDELRGEISHRALSLNLLVFGAQTLITPRLTLPHPEFHHSPEMLVPAAEVWGEWEHPVIGQDINSLARSVSDRFDGEFFAQGKTLLDF